MTKLLNKKKHFSSVLSLCAVATISALSATSVHAEPGDITTHIVGGNETSPNSRPYQVALLMNGRQGCGGTLISPNWVLTAGHCLDSASTNSLTVQVGAHSMSAGDGTSHRVSQIIKHEYWQGANNIQSGYDIAVLRLATPVSSSVTPASLPTQTIADQIAAVGQYVTVSGWGLTYGGSRTPSDRLREVALPVISNASCSSELGTNVGNGVICGGGPNGTSACNGDSGGPFAAQSGGKYYSIGTVSWGKGCVGATAFTRTTAYLDWIEQKTGVKPDSGTTPPDALPVARFSASVNGNTASFDNNSTDDKGVVSSRWTFGDGSNSTATNPSHTYTNAGSYTVTLTVTDTKGQTGSTASSVTIAGDPCTSSSNATYPAWSATTSYATGDKVSHQGTNYEATWWSTGATPTIYTNVWKAIGDNGGGDGECPVENKAPVARFSVATADLTASFSNNSTDDKAVVSHNWDFGDGSSSRTTSPSHTYANDGRYTVSLTVTDAEGLSNSTSQVVAVTGGVVVEPGCDGISAWSASTSYAVGDVVSYKGAKYNAIWWSTGAQPDVFSQVWTKAGTCSN